MLQPPPKFVHVIAATVYAADLPDPLFRTYCKLVGLAWGDQEHQRTRLPLCTVGELAILCHLKERAMQLHLADLKRRQLIQVTATARGIQIEICPPAGVQTFAPGVQTFAPLTAKPAPEVQTFAPSNDDVDDNHSLETSTATTSGVQTFAPPTSNDAPEVQTFAPPAPSDAPGVQTFAPLTPNDASGVQTFAPPAIWEALRVQGVEDTAEARAVAALPHVTPALIQAWATELAARPGVRNLPGLLLYELQRQTQPPPVETRGGRRGPAAPVAIPPLPLLVSTSPAPADELPPELWDLLQALGWCGPVTPVATAHAAEPARVLAWARYYADPRRRSGIHNPVGLFRHALAGATWPPDARPASSAAIAATAEPEPELEPEPESESEPEPALTLPNGQLVTVSHLWRTALTELELQLTRATFDTWLRDSACVGLADPTTLTVSVKNNYAVDWLANRLYPVIQRTLYRIFGQELAVQFVTA